MFCQRNCSYIVTYIDISLVLEEEGEEDNSIIKRRKERRRNKKFNIAEDAPIGWCVYWFGVAELSILNLGYRRCSSKEFVSKWIHLKSDAVLIKVLFISLYKEDNYISCDW